MGLNKALVGIQRIDALQGRLNEKVCILQPLFPQASVVIAVILTVRVLRDPEAVLGPVAASRVGRTGSIENVADPTVWPWVALAACAVALLGLVGAVRGLRVWGGPSSRYEVADAGGPVAGPRGERVASAWDELSAGRDPTDVGPDQRT